VLIDLKTLRYWSVSATDRLCEGGFWVCGASEGNSDLSVFPSRNLRRPILPLGGHNESLGRGGLRPRTDVEQNPFLHVFLKEQVVDCEC